MRSSSFMHCNVWCDTNLCDRHLICVIPINVNLQYYYDTILLRMDFFSVLGSLSVPSCSVYNKSLLCWQARTPHRVLFI